MTHKVPHEECLHTAARTAAIFAIDMGWPIEAFVRQCRFEYEMYISDAKPDSPDYRTEEWQDELDLSMFVELRDVLNQMIEENDTRPRPPVNPKIAKLFRALSQQKET